MSFKFNISPKEYAQGIESWVADILNTPGLRWKIWLINGVECRAGGIYLFDDESSVQTFLASPLMIELTQLPFIPDFRVTPFEVLQPQTGLTHGPVDKGARV